MIASSTWTFTMASIFTGATSSTGSSTGSTDPSTGGNVDKLKAKLKGQVGKLKTELIDVRAFLLDERVAKRCAKVRYLALQKGCDDILTEEDPTHSVLALFKAPFAVFESEEVLRSRISAGVLPC